jgi:hypothetical protein
MDAGFCEFELLAEESAPWPSDCHSVNSSSGQEKRVSIEHCNNSTIWNTKGSIKSSRKWPITDSGCIGGRLL